MKNHKNNGTIDRSLDRILREAPAVPLNDAGRWVIFSDLHLGNGGPKDDFKRNAPLFLRILESYYLKKGFGLILNGDIEELQRFSFKKIVNRWKDVFALFGRFQAGPGLIKIVGNHDIELLSKTELQMGIPVREAVRLEYGRDSLLVFHGHQARRFSPLLTTLGHWVVRFLASPLGITNYSTAANSRKKYRIEKRIYGFANERKIAAVIGHTHRPLFESLSKLDTLRFKIEQVCRRYPDLTSPERPAMERKIQGYLGEMKDLLARKDKYDRVGSLYQTLPPLPSVFNSGCGIGQSGLTGLEIADGQISLVHWFDSRRPRKELERNGNSPEPLADTGYYRVVLKSEPLDYIFTLIRLLSPGAQSRPPLPEKTELAGIKVHDLRENFEAA